MMSAIARGTNAILKHSPDTLSIFETRRAAARTCPSGSIKGDVKKKHSSSSARRGYFSDIQPPSADARILAEARLGRTDFAGDCGIMN